MDTPEGVHFLIDTHLLFNCHWFTPKNGVWPCFGVPSSSCSLWHPSFSWSTALAYWEFLASSPPYFLWEWQTCTAGRRQSITFTIWLSLISSQKWFNAILWSSYSCSHWYPPQFLLEYCPSLLGVLGIQSTLFSLGMVDMYCW